MRSGSDFQWNNIDGRCFGIYFQNSIAWRNRFGLHSFILYSVRVHPAFKNLGRDGKQCNDAPHGIDSDGNCGGMFRQRIETDFGGYCERGDASLMIING